VIFLENFDREYFLRILQSCFTAYPSFVELRNVISHYFIFFFGYDKFYSYFFHDYFEEVPDYYVPQIKREAFCFDFFFDFFYTLEKILGFGSFLLLHRAMEDVIVDGALLKDIYLKNFANKNCISPDIDLLDKNLNNIIYASVDDKLFTREGFYLIDIFFIFLFYFIFLSFGDWEVFFLEDYIVNEAPIEDLFTDLNLFYYDMLVEEAFEFFFLFFGNYILHHHSFSDFIFGFYQIDPEWLTSRSLFDAVVEEPGGYTGDSNAFYNRDETFFFWFEDPFLDDDFLYNL